MRTHYFSTAPVVVPMNWMAYDFVCAKTFQTRARTAIVLARLDLGGPPHQNPDGEKLRRNHLHLYREGYDDKYAFPLPEEFKGISDTFGFLDSFMDYCVIIRKPTIDKGVFA